MAWRRGQAHGQDFRDRLLAASRSICEVAEASTLTLDHSREWLRAEHGMDVCHGTTLNALKQLGLKLKKVAPSERTGARGREGGATGVGGGQAPDTEALLGVS